MPKIKRKRRRSAAPVARTRPKASDLTRRHSFSTRPFDFCARPAMLNPKRALAKHFGFGPTTSTS